MLGGPDSPSEMAGACGPYLLKFMPQVPTTKIDSYCSTLSYLRVDIRRKCREILDIDVVVILHANTRPHEAIRRQVPVVSLEESQPPTLESGPRP